MRGTPGRDGSRKMKRCSNLPSLSKDSCDIVPLFVHEAALEPAYLPLSLFFVSKNILQPSGTGAVAQQKHKKSAVFPANGKQQVKA